MNIKTNILGIEVSIELPYNNVEEFDQFMGMSGACLERATQYFLAHTHNARVRRVICNKLEELSGIERECTVNPENKEKKYSESEQRYVSRVEAEMKAAGKWGEIAGQLVAAAEGVRVVAEATRSSAPNKQIMGLARGLIEEGRAEAFCEKHGASIPNDWSNEANVVALANLVKKVVEEAKKQALI